KKIAMELGSNSPSIVLEDADMDEDVDSTVAGEIGAVGQSCLGVHRMFVQEKFYKGFKQQFVTKARQSKMGEKKDEQTDMEHVISENAAKRVEKWVDEAVKEGANVLPGGYREGAFYAPTVLENVPADAKIAKDEIFGPVVILFSVKTLEDA